MGLMKKLTSAVVASSLVLGLFGTALAAPTAEQANAAYERLNYYGIAEGILREDGTKDPALDENLTRAQMVTLLVKAFGQKEYADMLAGAQTFSDVSTDHWATGYIAIAMNLAAKHGNTIGYPDGTFGPENKVTAIEALGFVLKFLGVKVSGGDNWVEAMIAAAKDAGVITDADVELYLSEPNEPATRGLAFALADAIFYNYNGLEGGKSVYTKLDTVAPVVTLDSVATTTEKASVTISGTVSGDYREVFVGSEKVAVAEDGSFSAQVSLNVGANTIVVSAKDWAGNIGTASVDITRNPGAAAKIQITAPEGGVVAGSTIDLPVAVVDAEGADTGVTDFKVDAGEAGTWADGKLTAGTKAGKYTITASYEGLEPASIEIEIVAGPIANVVGETKSVAPGTAVKLIAVDQYGNPVEGATFAEAEEYAKAFIEGDQFIATEAGTYKIVATKGEETAEGTISVFGEHASFDIVIEDELVANGATEYEVKVVAVDEDGNAVTDFDGEVTLETNLDLVSDAKLKAKDGVATFKVKVPVGMDGLEADFTATYTNADEDIEIEASESFEIKAQVATKIELKADKYLAINDPAFSGSVRILDQLDKPMESGETFDVTLTISGPAYFEDTTDKELVVEASGGSLPFAIEPVDKFSEGTITITATAEGLTSATAEVTAAFAMAPKALTVNNVTTSARKAGTDNAQEWEFKVGLTDKNGVPVRADDDYEVTLTFDHEDADDELTVTIDGTPATLEDGEVKATLAGPTDTEQGAKELVVKVKSKGIVGDVKVTAEAEDLTSASNTISFKAGDLAQIAFTKSTLNVLNDTEYELVAQLQDEAENPVAKSGIKVTFSADHDDYANLGRGFGKTFTTYTDAEGKATVKVRVLDYENDFVLTAEAEGDDFTGSDTITLNVVKSVAKSISVSTYVYDDAKGWVAKSSVNAGDQVQVRAQVTDQRGMKVGSGYEGTLKLGGIKAAEINDGNKDADLPEFEWDDDFGWYTTFTARKAKTYSLTVSDKTSATEVKGTRGFTVNADTPSGLAYDGDKITYKKGNVKEIVLYVVDDYDNKVPASKVSGDIEGAEFDVKIDKGNGTYGIVSKSANGGGTDTLTVAVKKYTNSYKVYIVTDATDNATLEIIGEDENGDPVVLQTITLELDD